MADVFVEHMIKQKTTRKQVAIRMFTIFAAVLFALFPILLILFFDIDITFLTVLTILGAIWGGKIAFGLTSYEFEYIVTNGDLDIDRIAGKRSRKRVLTLHCKKFDILAPFTETYANEYNSKSIVNRLDYSRGPDTEGQYFAIFNDTAGQRTLMIFAPSKRMLEIFKIYIPGKIKNL